MCFLYCWLFLFYLSTNENKSHKCICIWSPQLFFEQQTMNYIKIWNRIGTRGTKLTTLRKVQVELAPKLLDRVKHIHNYQSLANNTIKHINTSFIKTNKRPYTSLLLPTPFPQSNLNFVSTTNL
jgi:hypothetical protein